MDEIDLRELENAHKRIYPYVDNTPVVESAMLGNKFLFKMEALQKTGSFKLRGALNALLKLKEKQEVGEVVAFSSGNHAQGLAYAAKLLGVKATIIIPKNAATNKVSATRELGANVVMAEDRKAAERICMVNEAKGAIFIHPFDNDDVIAGQGTACYEALQSGVTPDYIFAPCGGGGLLSGTYLSAKLLARSAEVWGAEPELANDASLSLKSGSIVRLEEADRTIADGARTPQVAERTFYYLKLLAGMLEIPEQDIISWTKTLTEELKTAVEPTAALAMAAAAKLIGKRGIKDKTFLVIISGGNVAV